MQEGNEPIQRELTDKEKRYVESYCVFFCKAKAARAAGYSKNTSKEKGYQLFTKVHIFEAIQARLKELSLGASETTKLISDIAKSNLNEFYDIVEIEQPTQIKKPLIEIIYELEEEVKFEDEFARRAGFTEEALETHHRQQQSRRLRILRLQMQLEKDPLAKHLVPGPPEKKQVAELNMVKLVQANEKGRIKSVTPSQFGTKVELYAADAALRDMAKVHGLYAPQKLDHTSNGKDIVSNLTDDELDARLTEALRKLNNVSDTKQS